MAHIAYFRVSTTDQSIEAQRHAMLKAATGGRFDKVVSDEGVSGSVPAAQRPGFAALLAFIREGDTLHVYAVDRLGRDALDVQSTVRALLERGVVVDIHGLGPIGRGVGELILAVLAQVADMERNRIRERTAAGRDKARESIASTGKTHKGKSSMGRPVGTVGKVGEGRQVDPAAVRQWRAEDKSRSIAMTAAHWGLSAATVKRYCAAANSEEVRPPSPLSGRIRNCAGGAEQSASLPRSPRVEVLCTTPATGNHQARQPERHHCKSSRFRDGHGRGGKTVAHRIQGAVAVVIIQDDTTVIKQKEVQG